MAYLVFIFANPVTLQIVLSHFGYVSLKNIAKNKNAPIVKKLTGICAYKAKQEQIDLMIGKINYSNYHMMKENLSNISTTISNLPSTNILSYLEYFENDGTSWIDQINKKLSC